MLLVFGQTKSSIQGILELAEITWLSSGRWFVECTRRSFVLRPENKTGAATHMHVRLRRYLSSKICPRQGKTDFWFDEVQMGYPLLMTYRFAPSRQSRCWFRQSRIAIAQSTQARTQSDKTRMPILPALILVLSRVCCHYRLYSRQCRQQRCTSAEGSGTGLRVKTRSGIRTQTVSSPQPAPAAPHCAAHGYLDIIMIIILLM